VKAADNSIADNSIADNSIADNSIADNSMKCEKEFSGLVLCSTRT